ncbi:MAG: nucleoside deaminase [Phycisphaerales bacterium]|nr:nucleoside deaminase [Phycisphaerales bacterium]MCB9841075.1 nucleoside deaminase [Phycisphaeraceae bacterium]
MDEARWMAEAIAEARAGMAAGQSPFGAVVVRDGAVVARGHNHVLAWTDATAHAEVVCIREACRAVGGISLAGCVMYSTCEPCPMCASAIHWARLDGVVWGASIEDARRAGFNELSLAATDVYRIGGSAVRAKAGVERAACAGLFDEFVRGGGRVY